MKRRSTPSFEHGAVKVHQQTDGAAAQAEVSQCLRFVNWKDALDGFEFELNGVLDNDVGEVALVEVDVFVDDGERNFAFEPQVGVLELPAKAMVMRRIRAGRGQVFYAPLCRGR